MYSMTTTSTKTPLVSDKDKIIIYNNIDNALYKDAPTTILGYNNNILQ